MWLHFHFVLLLGSSFAGLAEAQNSSNSLGIMGAVQDTSGAVIAGAEVALDRADGSELTRTVKDRTGEFHFKNLPPGSYLVDVQQPGFREVKVSARADGATHPPLRVVLSVAAAQEQVTVGASEISNQVSTEIAFLDLEDAHTEREREHPSSRTMGKHWLLAGI